MAWYPSGLLIIVILSPTTAAPVGYNTNEVTISILCLTTSISSILTLLLWNVLAEMNILSGLFVASFTITHVLAPAVNSSVVGYSVRVAHVLETKS